MRKIWAVFGQIVSTAGRAAVDKTAKKLRYDVPDTQPDGSMKLFASCITLGALLFAPQAIAQECDDQTCKQEWAALKKEQKKKRAAEAQAQRSLVTVWPAPIKVVQDYQPNPAIWRLADLDTTIYMFGTFHVLPKDFKWRSAALNSIVEEVDELVVETSDEDGDEVIGKFISDLLVTTMSDDRVTISERLSEANRAKWFAIGDGVDMPRDFFDRMPLMLSLLGAGLNFGETQGSVADYGVETVLEAEFKAADKPIGSIEDSSAVMAALLGIDENGLIKELDDELSKWDGKDLADFFGDLNGAEDNGTGSSEADPFSSEHSWAQGILEDLGMEEMKETEFGRQIYQVLLTDRNRNWAEWLENRLDTPGTILLAVGAGHFEGNDSVQNMLTERGLYAERLH
ncbi:TraB/GumN family protein [Pontixanthobacter aestiaquae]|uniref:TraB family protein n=1 Tax=Pontixanthobacter aestiaquae TaxID=1509367 RepID=A0A844Z7P4_9SPHN|nr:TraB/GumN family protein [Pontixanthobacter aestiaquae]MDN3645466.1 TraB/GumN family protein [Pontixanthobacter aestiaquae]MXO83534.1 hypothetical protein [Pontixanthobacter aestiaquae]